MSRLTAQKQHLSLGNIIVPRLVLLKRTSRKRNVIFSQEKSETFEVLTSRSNEFLLFQDSILLIWPVNCISRKT